MRLFVALAMTASLLPGRSGEAQVPPNANSPLRLPRLFGDGMVLQRDTPIPVWGLARPGARVEVALGISTATAVATGDGRWRVTLPAMREGGPHELTIASGGRRIVLRDVLVGDVWLASGQSNMELEVAHAADAAREIRSAHDPMIRQFKVPITWGWTREADVAGGSWAPADPQHVGAFTAVGYYFARELRKSVQVPIGLINSTWGGSAIETWLSREANGLTDSSWATLRRGEEHRSDDVRSALRARIGALPETDLGMSGSTAPWAAPALADNAWDDMPVPAYWEPHGYPDLDGVAWYRRTFDLADQEVADGATLEFAAIDDDDITWVNGVEVGRTTGYNVPRHYPLPRASLHAGRNVLVVRVTDGGGGGGINGDASLRLADGTRRSLAGSWKFRVGAVQLRADGQHINKIPAVTFNSMVNPLLPFPIKGVLWYQGESNANNDTQAALYRSQFVALIESWRREMSPRGTLPFLWVQLPNYGTPDSVPPAHPAWAVQREAMEGALALPRTGRAITIDVGGDNQLHPQNKQDVGARLARVALSVAYGPPVPASGPQYRGAAVRGDTMIVSFDQIGGGLLTHASDGRTVGSFAIAGADRRFVWANARIVGTQVEVWSDAVHSPVAVRYAWANAPQGPLLYNREGLPAAPFRTDRW